MHICLSPQPAWAHGGSREGERRGRCSTKNRVDSSYSYTRLHVRSWKICLYHLTIDRANLWSCMILFLIFYKLWLFFTQMQKNRNPHVLGCWCYILGSEEKFLLKFLIEGDLFKCYFCSPSNVQKKLTNQNFKTVFRTKSRLLSKATCSLRPKSSCNIQQLAGAATQKSFYSISLKAQETQVYLLISQDCSFALWMSVELLHETVWLYLSNSLKCML